MAIRAMGYILLVLLHLLQRKRRCPTAISHAIFGFPGGLWSSSPQALFLCPIVLVSPDGKDTGMGNKETKKRTSNFDTNRHCYMAKDGTAYYYERWSEEYGRYERIPLTVGKDGITEEIILLLDSMDKEEDLNNRYANDNKDPKFEAQRDRFESDPCGDDAVNPWDTVASENDDPVEIVVGEKEKDNPDVARVRKVIDTKCNDRQQNLFFAHFGEGRQLEEIRKEEVAATGKEKKLQAILNVKNDIIRKVADEYEVVPIKRRKRRKNI